MSLALAISSCFTYSWFKGPPCNIYKNIYMHKYIYIHTRIDGIAETG